MGWFVCTHINHTVDVDNLPCFGQALIAPIVRPPGKLHKLIDWNFKVYSMRQQIYDVQTKLRWENLWTQCNIWQKSVEIYKENNVLLTLCSNAPGLHKKKTWTDSLPWPTFKIMIPPTSTDEQERFSNENRRSDYQVNLEIRWIKEILHYLPTTFMLLLIGKYLQTCNFTSNWLQEQWI